MSTPILIAIAVVALMAVGLIFIIIRRTIQMAMRLALFGVFILVIAIGALVVWWYLPGNLPTPPTNQSRPSSTRPPARAR